MSFKLFVLTSICVLSYSLTCWLFSAIVDFWVELNLQILLYFFFFKKEFQHMASTFNNSSFIWFHVCLIVLQRPYAKVLYHFLYNHFVEVPNQWNFQIVVMFICLLKFPFNSFLLSICALTINLVIPHRVCTRLFVFFFF